MLYFLIFLLICETLYIVVLSSDIKRLERINKELNNEKQKISDKYEAGLFESKNCKKELEDLKDVEKVRYKEMAEKFFTDTGYYMKRVFELSKENKELWNENKKLNKQICKLQNISTCRLAINDKKIKKSAKEEFSKFIFDVIKGNYEEKYDYIFKEFTVLIDLSDVEKVKFISKNKRKILACIEKEIYFNQ